MGIATEKAFVKSNQKENAVKLKFDPRFTGWLLAGLVLSSAEAQAANGYAVSTNQENAIAIGMSASEVQQALGRPARTAHYFNAPGPTWTYTVIAPLFGRTEFNIDFGSDNRVIAKGEMVIGNDKPNQ